jgi:acyl-CoA thioesterase
VSAPDRGDELARACATAMLARDRHAQAMGIELEEAREGYARIAMTVRPEMTNGHDILHGGVTFSLGDSAFAYACNSRNEPNVALQCSISFTSAARLGDRLVAVAERRTAGTGRTSVYDVTVTRGDDLIALFRGVAYRIKGTVLTS